jgi:Na+/H+ antiporter NhaC
MSEGLPSKRLSFHGGLLGAVVPALVFFAGVTALALQGAPDERGLWPIVLLALGVSLVLARDRTLWSETVIRSMSQDIVALMVLAWLFSGVLAEVLRAAGLIQALVAAGSHLGLQGGGFAALSFAICALVATATGTSFGTILVCGPLLYPAGGSLAADPHWLAGAILAGSTFGDSISPISDTTIASAGTQGADIGGVVRSRFGYVFPPALLALVMYLILGHGESGGSPAVTAEGSLRALPMLLAPAVVLSLLFRKKHLLEGLLGGIMLAVILGLGLGLLTPRDLLFIDHENFVARGLILKGLERGVGVSIFTLLLMGLVGTLVATGLQDGLGDLARRKAHTPRAAEAWIVIAVSVAVLFTTHSVVAMLAIGAFAKETGQRFGLSAYRRANLLDVTVCTYPFLLPYFLPTILMSSATASGGEFGMPRLSPLDVGLFNVYSWGLLAMIGFAVGSGYLRGPLRQEKNP